jgi:hypothetical protein
MFFPRRIILMLECHLRALDADLKLSGNDILFGLSEFSSGVSSGPL